MSCVADTKTGLMQPHARGTRSPLWLEEAGCGLPWSLGTRPALGPPKSHRSGLQTEEMSVCCLETLVWGSPLTAAPGGSCNAP